MGERLLLHKAVTEPTEDLSSRVLVCQAWTEIVAMGTEERGLGALFAAQPLRNAFPE